MNDQTTTNAAYHYQIIARAIEILDRADFPIGLEALAQEMNMSSAHFQRIFSTWVGVSPKRYQQYLTLNHAKYMLQNQANMQSTALGCNLSGTGRLHDLFLRWEAMSPGEYAKGGAGLEIHWGWFDSPFGRAIVMGTHRGICGIGFSAEMSEDLAFEDLKQRWPKASFIHAPQKLSSWVKILFSQKTDAQEKAPLHLIGAPFQIKVWEALLNIPIGQVRSYSEVAEIIDNPKAVRAVGTAIGRNPISWLIPCHRALRKNGALGGYHWGLPLKRAMLAYESARIEADE